MWSMEDAIQLVNYSKNTLLEDTIFTSPHVSFGSNLEVYQKEVELSTPSSPFNLSLGRISKDHVRLYNSVGSLENCCQNEDCCHKVS